MYKFTITLSLLVIVTIATVVAAQLGGAEVIEMFLEFAVRIVFPILVLVVAGGMAVSQ
tara:strand:+ start:921 stop:1094 length:174 start_codon:yes stop_codon:yes gene_type:complete